MHSCHFIVAPVLIAFAAHPVLAKDEVSFSKQVQPILNQACVACHKPEKKKGKLDLTTYAAVMAGGSEGKTVVAGKPGESALVEQVTAHGNEPPKMPEKGEPLSAASVELLRKWVEQGAKDDTDASVVIRAGYCQPGPLAPTEPVRYRSAPVISAMALSPDGKTLAVAGRGEVLLVNVEGEPKVVARLSIGSTRITGLAYAAGGSQLVAAGGMPGQFGQVQAWDVAGGGVRSNWSVSGDTVFGLSVSSDGGRVAVGCADRTVRVIAMADGKELLNAQAHTDWVFGTALSGDGSTLVTASRDKSVKRIGLGKDGSTSPTVIDIAEPEQVGTCIARCSSADLVAVGSADGATRLYHVDELKQRTEKEKDPNRVREVERVNAPVNAVEFSPNGERLAVAGTGEVKVYKREGDRLTTLNGVEGPVYSVTFTPDGEQIYSAGFDGKVRLFSAKDGKVIREIAPFTL